MTDSHSPPSRERLDLERTRLANERTLLAYSRTAIMLAATGVSLLKFFREDAYSVSIGWGLITTATIVGTIGWRRYRGLSRRLGP